MAYSLIDLSPKNAARFVSRIYKHGPIVRPELGECWLWRPAIRKWTYGTFGVRAVTYHAHHIAWEICNGRVPRGLLVCHHCDNPPCVNPKHLFVGTALDNNHDMIAKGRAAWQKRARLLVAESRAA